MCLEQSRQKINLLADDFWLSLSSHARRFLSSCPWISDSSFFSLWTLRLTPAGSLGFLGFWLQTDGCTTGFLGFEAFRIWLATTGFSFFSLLMDFTRLSEFSLINSLLYAHICTYICTYIYVYMYIYVYILYVHISYWSILPENPNTPKNGFVISACRTSANTIIQEFMQYLIT